MDIASLLSQCPCGGGEGSAGGGISQFAVMAVSTLGLGLWLAIRWAKSTWNKEGSNMQRVGKFSLIVVLVGAMVAIVGAQVASRPATESVAVGQSTAPAEGVPKLVDLGSKHCIPCKQMEPILDELRRDYAGRLDVEFIDVSVRSNAAAAQRYNIKLIPTQVFLDAGGKELWRHEGFLSKADILAKWKQLGYDFSAAPASRPAASAPADAPSAAPAPADGPAAAKGSAP
jgi:thioredoxin 1